MQIAAKRSKRAFLARVRIRYGGNEVVTELLHRLASRWHFVGSAQ